MLASANYEMLLPAALVSLLKSSQKAIDGWPASTLFLLDKLTASVNKGRPNKRVELFLPFRAYCPRIPESYWTGQRRSVEGEEVIQSATSTALDMARRTTTARESVTCGHP